MTCLGHHAHHKRNRMRVSVSYITWATITLMLLRASAPASAMYQSSSKHLWILRHGQAMHNPRAETAKDGGCSHQEFLRLMQLDDSLDSELTGLGKDQARAVHKKWGHLLSTIPLVVSSPLSRALQTADAVIPPITACQGHKRIVLENVREINGWLLNAKRRTKGDIQIRFPHWNLDDLHDEEDTWWTSDLETEEACRERGYQGFCWLLDRPEAEIALVAHGGILRFTMLDHPLVRVTDARQKGEETSRGPADRFGNCELRKYRIDWDAEVDTKNDQKAILLTEVDLAEAVTK